MDFTVKHFSELTNEELYDILRLRVNVFVVEQECPYPEIDGNDSCAYHVFHRGEDGALDAYLRCRRGQLSRRRRWVALSR